jgi:hypothetical protein
LLCGAALYIGSSLHCAMTVMACGRPAAIIHRAPLTKLQDMYGHCLRSDLFSYDWNHFAALLEKLHCFSDNDRKILRLYVEFMQATFDVKLDNLLGRLTTCQAKGKS